MDIYGNVTAHVLFQFQSRGKVSSLQRLVASSDVWFHDAAVAEARSIGLKGAIIASRGNNQANAIVVEDKVLATSLL